jgi:hypothetical protein
MAEQLASPGCVVRTAGVALRVVAEAIAAMLDS